MRTPGLRRLRHAARRVRARLVPGALVIGYHRVAEAPPDPDGMCVAPARFAEQLEVVRRLASPLLLGELAAALEAGGPPPRAVALAFDDGYADVLHAARPLLERHEVPATVFLVSGALGGEFWWDRLDRILAGGADRRRLHARLRPLSAAAREEALAALAAERGEAPPAPGAGRPLTRDEALRLADGRLVEAGAHTRTHPALTGLAPAEARAEIREGKAELEGLFGRPLAGFAYPHGATSARVAAEVGAAGFRYGATSEPGAVHRGADRLRLPRLWAPDVDGERFAGWLRGWLPG